MTAMLSVEEDFVFEETAVPAPRPRLDAKRRALIDTAVAARADMGRGGAATSGRPLETVWCAALLLVQARADGLGADSRLARTAEGLLDQAVRAGEKGVAGRAYAGLERWLLLSGLARLLQAFPRYLGPAQTYAIKERLRAAVRDLTDAPERARSLAAWLLVEYGDRTRGEAMAEALADQFFVSDALDGFNGTNAAGVDLWGASLWCASESALLREEGARIRDGIWADLARFYHPGLENLCGPYPEAGPMDMRSAPSITGAWVAWAIPGGSSGVPLPDVGAPHALARTACALPAMVDAEPPRAVARQLAGRGPAHAIERVLGPSRRVTAWLEPNVMIGAAAISEPDEVFASPVSLHWRHHGGVGWMRMDRDRGCVNAGCKQRLVTLEDVDAAVFEFGGLGEGAVTIVPNRITLPGLDLAFDGVGTFDAWRKGRRLHLAVKPTDARIRLLAIPHDLANRRSTDFA